MSWHAPRFLTVWLALAAPGLAQAPATPPAAPAPAPAAVDPALPEQLKELKGMVADPKMAADFQAIGLIQQLAKNPDQRHPKDKERLAKGLGDVFRTGKVRPADKDHLYREAGQALGRLGADGARELSKTLTEPRLKDAIPTRCHLILALGQTEDDKQVDWLLDEATRSPHDEIRAAAGEALGSFTSLDQKARREVVKQLLRAWGSLHSKGSELANKDPNAPIDLGPETARKTLQAIEGKWNRTLSKLTGVSFSAFPDWQRWLNKNPNWVAPAAPKKP